ncbi:MAG: Rrf2 family transcriptional regulator [Bdellovibrionales bacterium]|nr:Rrf2 family transcriptional regulator [Bdellovibrionales bacterium]
MSFSSRHAISTHILMVLACCPNLKASSDRLAASVNTNSVVIRRLLAKLRDAGLVTVQKGPDGGYSLAKAPSEISLWDIFEAVEELPLFHAHHSRPNPCCCVGACIEVLLEDIYLKSEEAIKAQFSDIRLQHLLRKVTG